MSGHVLGRRRSRRPARNSARWPARIAALAGAGVILLALAAPPAGANYGRVTARIGCDRVVEWTASASSEGGAEDRTNRQVLVEYRATDGQDPLRDWVAAGPVGRFDAANDFRFTGSFALPEGADSVDLRVTPRSDWGVDGSGDPAGGPRFSRVELPAGCADQPLVASVVEDCANGGARVTVRNVGDGPHSVVVSADGVPVRELQLAPDGTDEVIVPLLEGRPSAVRVAAGDFVVSESTIGADCGITGPAAVVIERCGGRQAVVLATLGDQPAGEAAIRVAGTIAHQTALEPGTVLQRTLELPPSGAVGVEVTVGGTVLALADVGGCEGPVAGAITCGVAGRPDCQVGELATGGTPPPPPPPPPPITLELDEPMLPRTGPWERAIALLVGGGLLLAGGVAVASRDRRRPLPSPVASAIAPYRQQWWDDTGLD